MKYLSYKYAKNSDELFVENVAVAKIAAEVGTPFYCYSKKSLIENYHAFSDAFDE